MTPFRRCAIFTVARDTSVVAFASLGLMVVFSFAPPLALDAAATVALIFAVGLLIRALCLTEDRLLRSEAWQSLSPDELPDGEPDRHWAREELEALLLHFAMGAAGVAGILYGSALIMSAAA